MVCSFDLKYYEILQFKDERPLVSFNVSLLTLMTELIIIKNWTVYQEL